MYECETEGVMIRVEPDFLDDESDPDEGRYVWAYTIEIENRGERTLQLIAREWEITDSQGRIEIVRGDGVVGEQPVLRPGETFRYTSGAPLATSSGFMCGNYQMRREDGTRFDARIPAFSLDTPYDRSALH
ncbi:MAG: Co2+/Mg2+ efflux protein ApaG [Maricaulis sp.]|nr:Co2+/Mg2+ efflux protein ApaG [Maricaulis sp.]HAQ34432.1 Co2+/Mg2+ efflux protein ApaG [Alphaproteobacteria bacterium]